MEYYSSSHAKQHPILETVPSVFNRANFAPGTYMSFKNLKFPAVKKTSAGAAGTKNAADAAVDSDDDDAADAPQVKRNPDAGLTAFIRFGDEIPLGHPHGEYPRRWKGARVSYRGIQMIAQMKHLFAVIPSMHFPPSVLVLMCVCSVD